MDARAQEIRLTEDLGAEITDADDALRPAYLPAHSRIAATSWGLAWVWEDPIHGLMAVIA